MEGVNPFIKSNKHQMIMFLDELGVSMLLSLICQFYKFVLWVFVCEIYKNCKCL